jgi:hypothetical protein
MELLPGDLPEPTSRERTRNAVGAGCFFCAAVFIGMMGLALFNPQGDKSLATFAEFGICLLCFLLPFFAMVAVGTYVQSGYQVMLLRRLKRWASRVAERKNENPQ